ncbi:DNA helicase RecQ [Clostridium vincentii]|uniref:DNA helicase RecQ n=1 Tax=Clostridium vincentii TaxID=52704 RepID=A0A2T0BFB6_9CLOT|nr:DNA helicase RecQ [Clostridium vincentii]PRR82558.1 ATP-dependent DNA helicase RecQ [Clostridium vincentii]
MKEIRKILEKYYGYKDFRPGQEKIISNILNKKDLLAVMPTGAGKSICFQIPALLLDGVTLVVSPLVSLMKDQVDALSSVGIKAAFLNSTLDTNEFNEVLYGLKNNEYKMIYIAPERLDSRVFLDTINSISISQIAIDEAHCVSQWGHDFRVSYRKIGDFIESFTARPVITAFTATASQEVQKDIVKLLRLRDPEVFVSGFDRENLEINVIKEGRKDRFLKEYLKKNSQASGIIYCATRKEVNSIYEDVKALGYSACKYHAGLSDKERKEYQDLFIKDKKNIMVATNAFGMGIDKPNVRFVIHNNMPQSIEGYYQEIGRAGRDGEKSECILLFTPGDIHMQKYLIDVGLKSEDRKAIAYKKLQEMVALVHSSGCYRKFILNYFGEELKEDCNNCSNCLSDGEEQDRTIDAQKVLSCIGRMKRGYGATILVDVLRGSKNQKIISLDFNNISTYGIMKDYKKDDLVGFINTLISHGFMEQVEGTYPILRLNPLSVKVLKGEEKVIFKNIKVKDTSFDYSDLFNKLKALRFNIATEQKVPPYVVFGDRTLKEMSNDYPLTKEQMLEISGVGEMKYEKYGEAFIKVIAEYVSTNNIVKGPKIEVEKKLPSNFNVSTDENLYLKLRELREKFAAKESKIPYSIISQNTLKEISGRYPINLADLKDITGLGPKKVETYGKKIINLVKAYVEEKNIEVNWSERNKLKLVIDGEDRKNEEIAISMLEEGHHIKKISLDIEVSVSSILGYVTDYIKETGDVSFNLNLKEFYEEEEEEVILKACNKIGIDKVSDIKKTLNPSINYQAIRAVILKNFYNIA